MSDEYSPVAAPHTPKDKRLALRISAADLGWWRATARTEQRSLSAMIRDVVDQYIEYMFNQHIATSKSFFGLGRRLGEETTPEEPKSIEQPQEMDGYDGEETEPMSEPAGLRPFGTLSNGTENSKRRLPSDRPYDRSIVLRIPATDLQLWTRAAEQNRLSLSDLIRKAVTCHVQDFLDQCSDLIEKRDG